ncbi:MAG: cobyrinate a,c-diamide synthase [Cyanobacteria bacterium J06621_3]
MSIILAGDRSGTGKTTLTLALLAALKQQGRCVQSFKVGPDYIDPMFHSAVTKRPCYNLDPVLTSEAYVQQSFHAHCIDAQQAVVEGVMGLFDGATGIDDTASTAHIARLLGLPVVLGVDCGRMARSVAALVQGYRDFDRRVQVAGIILNRVGSDRHLQLLEDAIASTGLPILGVFRREKDIQLPSRHLGLVPTGEVGEFGQIVTRLAALGQRYFDWEKLEPLLGIEKGEGTADGATGETPVQQGGIDGSRRVRIAIARDAAFNFYYPDNFEALEAQGATLVYWSPLTDSELPKADGLYFGGGFPEVFAKQLAENVAMRHAVQRAISQGIPTYAECGGLMYLSQSLIDFEGEQWPMVGVIPQTVKMGERLALGYRKGWAIANTPLLAKGQTIVGHEFHKSAVVEPLSAPVYESQRYWGESGEPRQEGYGRRNLHASYVHLCWGDRPEIPQRFIAHCKAYARTWQPN